MPLLLIAFLTSLMSVPVYAEVIRSSDGGFISQHVVTIERDSSYRDFAAQEPGLKYLHGDPCFDRLITPAL